MPTLTVTDARKHLFGLIDEVANEHQSYCIVGKRNQAILISMKDWQAIQESLYLNGVPGLADSIIAGMKTPISECAEDLEW
ncbi:MAG: type II toxin-antitoxin system Phd/YefM family antitoxin [Kiritimatiellae bacterium]|nr:type II toxin-antitoxin system Phd/YefM family antitoxin [Kiritimatiellia bacterium]